MDDQYSLFRYYSDGECEYRIERGATDSGVHATARPNMRYWKLFDRFAADDQWKHAGTVYMINTATWRDAERRLLRNIKLC